MRTQTPATSTNSFEVIFFIRKNISLTKEKSTFGVDFLPTFAFLCGFLWVLVDYVKAAFLQATGRFGLHLRILPATISACCRPKSGRHTPVTST